MYICTSGKVVEMNFKFKFKSVFWLTGKIIGFEYFEMILNEHRLFRVVSTNKQLKYYVISSSKVTRFSKNFSMIFHFFQATIQPTSVPFTRGHHHHHFGFTHSKFEFKFSNSQISKPKIAKYCTNFIISIGLWNYMSKL